MPISGLSLVTVTGSFRNLQTGGASAGMVRFEMSGRLVNQTTNDIVVPEPFTAVLDANGDLSIVLPATDDADFAPTSRFYAVTEFIDGQTRRYAVVLPASPSTQDLADIAPIDPVDEFSVYGYFNSDEFEYAHTIPLVKYQRQGLTDYASFVAAVNEADGDRFVIHVDAAELDDGEWVDLENCCVQGSTSRPAGGTGGSYVICNGDSGFWSSTPNDNGFWVRNIDLYGDALNNPSAPDNDQILVDFTGQNYPKLRDVRFWYAALDFKLANTVANVTPKRTGGTYSVSKECHYGKFEVDFNYSNRGCFIEQGAHSHNFFGGRLKADGQSALLWDAVEPEDVGTLPGGFTRPVRAIGIDIALAVQNINVFGMALEGGDDGPPTDTDFICGVRSAGTSVTFFGSRLECNDVNVYILKNPDVDANGVGPHVFFGGSLNTGFMYRDENTPSVVTGYLPSTNHVGGRPTLANRGAVPHLATPRNLLVNGGFDHETQVANRPDGWTFTASSAGTSACTTESALRAGAAGQSVKLVSGTGNNVRLFQNVSVKPGHVYTLRFVYKLVGTFAGSEGIRIGDATGGDSSSAVFKNLGFSPSVTGEVFTAEQSFAPDVNLINITCYITGSATSREIHLDEMVLNEGYTCANSFIPQDINENGGRIFGNIGFYGKAPIAQQTGVAVDAAGIHAALVALGLITA